MLRMPLFSEQYFILLIFIRLFLVNSECQFGFFGEGCNSLCKTGNTSHCVEGDMCDVISGAPVTCNNGCQGGNKSYTWWYGQKCTEALRQMNFGSLDTIDNIPVSVGSTSVTWRWKEGALVPRGAVVGYHIYYWYNTERHLGADVKYNHSTEWQTGTVTGLLPGTECQFNISVYRQWKDQQKDVGDYWAYPNTVSVRLITKTQACPHRTYGPSCTPCGTLPHCTVEPACDPTTGDLRCNGDCEGGEEHESWWFGEKCDQELSILQFGGSDIVPRTPVRITETSVTWKWKESSIIPPEAVGSVGYRLYYKLAAATNWTLGADVPYSEADWQEGTVSNLQPGTKYYFDIAVYRRWKDEVKQEHSYRANGNTIDRSQLNATTYGALTSTIRPTPALSSSSKSSSKSPHTTTRSIIHTSTSAQSTSEESKSTTTTATTIRTSKLIIITTTPTIVTRPKPSTLPTNVIPATTTTKPPTITTTTKKSTPTTIVKAVTSQLVITTSTVTHGLKSISDNDSDSNTIIAAVLGSVAGVALITIVLVVLICKRKTVINSVRRKLRKENSEELFHLGTENNVETHTNDATMSSLVASEETTVHIHTATRVTFKPTSVLDSAPAVAVHERPQVENQQVPEQTSVTMKPAKPEVMPKPTKEAVAPIPLPTLKDYITENMAEDRKGFKSEYEAIPKGKWKSCDAGESEANIKKNRFTNIFAYDTNRVHLDQELSKSDTDYINASYIKRSPESSCASYIATQGPTKKTLVHFWAMIWQLKVNRIVMLTKEFEAGKRKCEVYWPENTGEKKQFEEFAVTAVSCESYTIYTLRVFEIAFKGETRTIRHLHFLPWPDKSVPELPVSLLAFRHKVRSFDHVSTGPMVVHCSAGVGRTGTFIAIDILLEQIKSQEDINIVSIVTMLREQRMLMVQTMAQYIFVYESVLDAYTCGEHAYPCGSFLTDLQNLVNDGQITKQFKVLNTLRPAQPKNDLVGLSSDNYHKNRDTDIIPRNIDRVTLQTKWEDRNNYINAVFIDSYGREDSILVTQMPLEVTVVDFWRMIFDHKVDTIVTLDMDKNGFPTFLPECNAAVVYGPIEVTFVNSDTSGSVSVNEFKIRNSKKEQSSRHVYQLIPNGWDADTDVPTTRSMIDLVEVANKTGNKKRNKVAVLCSNGATRSGLFCASSNLIEAIKIEQKVDVFSPTRQIFTRRPQFINTVNQYQFLYSLAKDYLAMNDAYGSYM